MSILTDLRAALDTALASEQMKGKAWDDFRDLLDTDTIRALIDVAEAAEAKAYCPLCDVALHVETAWSTPHMPYCPLAPLVKEATDE